MPRIIDLTMPYVPGNNIEAKLQDDLPVYAGHECHAWDLAIKSHTGTYFETSSHVFRDGADTDSVPAADLVMDACVVRLDEERSGAIDAPELQAEAGAHGLREGDALLVATSGNRDRYFTEETAAWMASRGVGLVGAELDRYDTGFVDPTGFFVTLFRAEIPIVAELVNWDDLPEGRCRLMVMPLLVRGVCTVPARVVAMVD